MWEILDLDLRPDRGNRKQSIGSPCADYYIVLVAVGYDGHSG